MQFVLWHSFGLFLPKTLLDEPLVLSAQVSDKNNPKQRCNYFDCRFCESQNLVNFNPCEAPKTKFLMLFAFAKRRIPINSTNSNPPNKEDSQNLYTKTSDFVI